MRILVADDHELVRKGLRSLLATDSSIILCGEAVDGEDAISKTAALHPDIIIMDVNMPRLNGVDATRQIKARYPEIGIVIVSQHEAPELVRAAFAAGASGYVGKSSVASDLLSVIAKVSEGQSFVTGTASGSAGNFNSEEILKHSARMEQALRESEERFRTAMTNMAEGLYMVDTQGLVTYINPSAEEMFGWSSMELLGKKMHDVVHYKYPDGRPFPAADCPGLQVLEKGLVVSGHEDYFIRKDGSLFPVTLSAAPIKTGNRTTGVVVSFRDDTKSREAHDAIRQNEKIYRAIGESIDFGVWTADGDGRNVYTSPRFLNLVGLTEQQCSESGWMQALHPDDIESVTQEWLKCIRSGDLWEKELRFRRADGGWQHILTRGVPIRDDRGKIQFWAGINLDIQNRKQAEIALEERIAERTEELTWTRNELRNLSVRLLKTQDDERRRIARELHDGIGQLLAAMNMNLSTLGGEKSKLSADSAKLVDDNRTLVDQALRDIRTMSYLLHPPLLDEIGLASALRWYLDGFAERSKIAVNLDIAPEIGKLPRDMELSLFRIVQECLTNIHRHSGSPTARVRLYRTPEEVLLEVKDEGKGIPPKIHSSVASSVASEENFGMGLRGIRERLRQFGGRLDLQSNGTGTLVTATLPASHIQASTEDSDSFEHEEVETLPSTAPSDSDSSIATILCIDDEPAGMFARRLLLESAGHRVIEARSGAEGIKVFKSEKVDAVVLDYWMSGMKGTAVAAEIKGMNPLVPIIVLSGLPEFPGEATGVVDEWLLKGNHRAEHLLTTVKTLLERRAV